MAKLTVDIGINIPMGDNQYDRLKLGLVASDIDLDLDINDQMDQISAASQIIITRLDQELFDQVIELLVIDGTNEFLKDIVAKHTERMDRIEKVVTKLITKVKENEHE